MGAKGGLEVREPGIHAHWTRQPGAHASAERETRADILRGPNTSMGRPVATTVEDRARIERIARYEVLDGPAPTDLDGLVRLAASVCAVPKAVINIIDERHQHQIAAVGFEPA